MNRTIIGSAALIAGAWLSACAASAPPMECQVAHLVYQKDADKCVNNDLVACGSVLLSKCQARCSACSEEFPQLQAAARDKLSGACSTGQQSGCRGLDSFECERGNETACAKLRDQYLKLAAACHADKSQCATIGSSPWPQRMRPEASKLCDNGAAAACGVLKGSATLDTL